MLANRTPLDFDVFLNKPEFWNYMIDFIVQDKNSFFTLFLTSKSLFQLCTDVLKKLPTIYAICSQGPEHIFVDDKAFHQTDITTYDDISFFIYKVYRGFRGKYKLNESLVLEGEYQTFLLKQNLFALFYSRQNAVPSLFRQKGANGAGNAPVDETHADSTIGINNIINDKNIHYCR